VFPDSFSVVVIIPVSVVAIIVANLLRLADGGPPTGNRRRNIVEDDLRWSLVVELKQAATDLSVPDTIRADVRLLLAIGTLWGSETLTRVSFEPVEEAAMGSAFDVLLQPFRHT
jgi:hypothetical protein